MLLQNLSATFLASPPSWVPLIDSSFYNPIRNKRGIIIFVRNERLELSTPDWKSGMSIHKHLSRIFERTVRFELTTLTLATLRTTPVLCSHLWNWLGSNQLPLDLQSSTLPNELQFHRSTVLSSYTTLTFG